MTSLFELKFKKLETVKSTNDFLKQFVKEKNIDNGTFVIADFQTGGKGQKQKSWVSNFGENLLFTMYLSPSKKDIIHLNYSISLALLEFIQGLLRDHLVELKWPNDILVDGKKIAGILIENTFKNNKLSGSFVGVGLNVNQKKFPSFSREACSLSLLLGVDFNVVQLGMDIAQDLFAAYSLDSSKQMLQKEYVKSLYLRNKLVLFELEGEKVLLKIFGVDQAGNLLVIDEKGELLSFRNGMLQFLE